MRCTACEGRRTPSCRVTGLFCGSLSSTTTRLLGLSPTGRQRSAHTVVIVCESPLRGCREPLSTTMCLAAHTETRARSSTFGSGWGRGEGLGLGSGLGLDPNHNRAIPIA